MTTTPGKCPDDPRQEDVSHPIDILYDWLLLMLRISLIVMLLWTLTNIVLVARSGAVARHFGGLSTTDAPSPIATDAPIPQIRSDLSRCD